MSPMETFAGEVLKIKGIRNLRYSIDLPSGAGRFQVLVCDKEVAEEVNALYDDNQLFGLEIWHEYKKDDFRIIPNPW